MREPTDGEAIDVEPLEHEVVESFKDFWAPIVMPNGEWDLDQVMRELHDYQLVLDNVPQVYMHITRHKMSKAHYPAAAVIAEHDESCEFKVDLQSVIDLAEAALDHAAEAALDHAGLSEEALAVEDFARQILAAIGDLIESP